MTGGGFFDHLAESTAGCVEVVLQAGDLLGEVAVALSFAGELAGERSDPVDQRRSGDVGELSAEGAAHLLAQGVSFATQFADFLPREFQVGA
jgi:hypothetical protein